SRTTQRPTSDARRADESTLGSIDVIAPTLEPTSSPPAPPGTPDAAQASLDTKLAPAAADRRQRPALLRIAGAVGLAAAIGAGISMVPARSDPRRTNAPPQPPASPLAAPDSVLACPILEVPATTESAGWLGAAAAHLACTRAAIVLGGRSERTLVPAELL